MVMKIKRVLASLLFLIGSGMLASASGAGYTFSLDLREGVRLTGGKETIQWNSDWDDEGTTNTVTVTVGDEILVEDETGSGAVTWLESEYGLYTLVHTTTSADGEVLDTMTAQFVVYTDWRGEMDIVVSNCTNVYDGLGHSLSVAPQGVSEYTVSYSLSADGPFTSESPVFTNLVTTSVWYRVRAEDYTTAEGEVTFVITEATFADGSIVATDYLGAYDGDPHTITVTAPSTATVTFALSEAGPFTSTNPSFTDIVSTSVWYRVEQYGYTTVTGSASLTIAYASFGDGVLEVSGYSGIFDGQYHSITVTAPSSVTVTYALSEDGPYTALLPTFRDAVSTSVWYRAEKTGYTTVTASESVVIGLDEGCPFDLDLRSDPRESDGTETLQWSGLWAGDAASTVTVSVDGETALVDGGTGAGEASWSETAPGTYDFTHVTYSGGEAVETLTAQFVIPEPTPGDLEMEVLATGYAGVYDGTGHTITVEPQVDVSQMVLYALSPDGPFTSEIPVFTNSVSTSVWYCVVAEGYSSVTGSVDVVINALGGMSLSLVRVSSRYPWEGAVDIDCSLGFDSDALAAVGIEAPESVSLTVSATDPATGETLAVSTLTAGGESVTNGAFAVGTGQTRLTWDAAADLTAGLSWSDLEISVTAATWDANVADAVASATGVALDLREDPRKTDGSETIQWSGLWDGDEESVVIVRSGSTAYVNQQSGEGSYEWTTTTPGTNKFYHVTYQNSKIVSTRTATFILPEPGEEEPLAVTFAEDVQAQQRYPWNGLVDIDCALDFAASLGTASLTVSATDLTTGDALTVETLTVDGTEVVNGSVEVGSGSVRVTWDAAADGTEGFTSTNLAITVVAENANATGATNTVEGVSLDLRTSPRTRTQSAEVLCYDALWYGGGSGTVTMAITDNGAVFTNGLTGAGTVSWDSLVTGSHTLTLVTYVDGVEVDTRTASFYETGTTSQGVPYTWLEEQWLILPGDNLTHEDFEAAAAGDQDGDGYPEWEEYVVGTDPWDETSYGFSIVSITMDADGLPVIVWEPDLNEGGSLTERVYTVLEADSPAGPWTEGSGTDSADGRTMETGSAPKKFYKVTVGLPQ